MKRLATAVCVFVIVMGVNSALLADIYTLSDSYLLDTTNFVVQTGGTLNSRTDLAGDGVRYNITSSDGTGWWDIQIGDGFDLPTDNAGLATGFANSGSDFTAYDSYELLIHNPNTDGASFMANIYMNVGWTDSPWLENVADGGYIENGWTWVNPGETVKLTLDLTSLSYLNHVSNIGLKIGANLTGDGSWNPEMGPGVTFDVDIVPVPLPAAVLLGMLGLGAAGLKLRKYV